MIPPVRALVYESVLGLLLVIGLPLVALEWGPDIPLLVEDLQAVGLLLALPGAALWLWAAWVLVLDGQGTPLPLDPPRRLVSSGPYRYLRNPMHLGLVAFLAGEALLFRSPVLLVLVAALGAAAVAYGRGREERELAARFGLAYERYRRAVPGWVPRPRRERS